MKDKAKNVVQISKGKAKAAAGGALSNKKLANAGRSDKRRGNLKQAGEKVKDAFKRR